jgi:hypothetical protein
VGQLRKAGNPAGDPAARVRGRSALGREWHERDVAGALDGCTKLALVSSTITGDTAWNDFPALGNQVPQALDVFIINIRDLIRTKAANLLPGKTPFRRHPVVASCARLERVAWSITPMADDCF